MLKLFSKVILATGLVVCVLATPTLSVGADSPSEAYSEAAASGLGNMLREIGADISGGSIPAIEHLLSNWDNVRNPCRNTLALLGAIFKDARDREGQNFAFTLIKLFDIQQFGSWTFAGLEAQGEYLSKKINENRMKNLAALRRAMVEIRRRCYPPKPTNVTTGGSGTPVPPVTAGGGAQTPTTTAQPEPKPEAKPAPKPEPKWSVDNPCPECQPIADDLAAEKKTMAELQAEKGQVDQAAIDNQVEQGDIGKRIATLNARIESQKGTFAESRDPESGLTIRAENVGGGTVRVTTRDGSGNIVDDYTRDSGSANRMKQTIKDLERQLKDLKQKEADLRKKSDDLAKKIDASQEKIDDLAKALKKCVDEKCKKLVACPKPPAGDAMTVGANSEVGSGAQLKAKVKETIGGLFGGAIGGLLGGRRGGSEGDDHDEPQTVRDPVPAENQKSFTNAATGTTVKVGGMVDKKGLLVSCHIDDAPGDGTFQTAFIENSDGQRAGPTDYLVYEMYSEWALMVSWTRDEWVDGQHVDHQEGGWDESGRNFLGTFKVPVENDGIWKKLGFNNAVKGIQALGARFPITKEQLQAGPVNLVVHITRPKEDPVTTTPFVFLVSLTPEGELQIEQVNQTLAQSACDPTKPAVTSPGATSIQ